MPIRSDHYKRILDTGREFRICFLQLRYGRSRDLHGGSHGDCSRFSSRGGRFATRGFGIDGRDERLSKNRRRRINLLITVSQVSKGKIPALLPAQIKNTGKFGGFRTTPTILAFMSVSEPSNSGPSRYGSKLV